MSRLKTGVILRGFLRLIDVSGWQKWLGAAVLGFAFALNSSSLFSLIQLQGLVLGVPLILSYIQSVNDCFDVQIDEIKEKFGVSKLIVSKIISRKTALATTFLMLLLGLLSSWICSINLFIISCIMALFGTLYSVPPFRLKMVYPFSTLIQFAGCFLPFLAGISVIGIVTPQTIIISSVFAVIAMIHRFDHEISNYRVDFQTGKKTVAVVRGLRTTIWLRRLSTLIGVAEFIVFFFLGWLNFALLFLFGLYLFMVIFKGVWLRFLPPPLKAIFAPLMMVSSYFLLLVVLLLYGKNYVWPLL
jgi:4-hydroxybenzoate polyprenyltransferase